MSKESLIAPMICKMCGAPLKGCECEYCGTKYYVSNEKAAKQDIAYLQRQLIESSCQISQESQRLMMYQNIINGCNTRWPLV